METNALRTIAAIFARKVGHLTLLCVFAACALVIGDATTETVRADTPGVVECFNSSTGQIFTMPAGQCPR